MEAEDDEEVQNQSEETTIGTAMESAPKAESPGLWVAQKGGALTVDTQWSTYSRR